MRILSIDWNYFAEATVDERFVLFPDIDNENISTKTINFIWTYKYSNSNTLKNTRVFNIRELSNIPLKEKDFNILIDIIKNQNTKSKSYIANNHYCIYETIKELNNNNIELYNIDFHHHMFSFNKNKNCGNWLYNLIYEGYIKKSFWIKDTFSNIEDLKSTEIIDIHEIQGDFDIIFLAKSSLWSPPHLDKYFNILVDVIMKKFNESMFYGDYVDLLSNRYSL
jgi:hypothetical protein